MGQLQGKEESVPMELAVGLKLMSASAFVFGQKEHGKSYNPIEDNVRWALFNRTDKLINVQNANHAAGKEPYHMQHNFFSDLVIINCYNLLIL